MFIMYSLYIKDTLYQFINVEDLTKFIRKLDEAFPETLTIKKEIVGMTEC